MMSPDGSLGEVPSEQVEAAKVAGFRLMTAQDMADMFQRSFMTQKLIEHKDTQLRKKFARRQSLRQQMRSGRRG